MKKTEREVLDWLKEHHVLNRFFRNVRREHPTFTLKYLMEYRDKNIIMNGFTWSDCNSYFNDDVEWYTLCISYNHWLYNDKLVNI